MDRNNKNYIEEMTKSGLFTYTISLPKMWLIFIFSCLQHVITVGTPFFMIFMMSQLWFIDNPVTYIQLAFGFVIIGGLWISTSYVRDQLFYNILLDHSINISSNSLSLLMGLPYSYIGNLPVESQFMRFTPLENLSYTWFNNVVKPLLDLPLIIFSFATICFLLGFTYFCYIAVILISVVLLIKYKHKATKADQSLSDSQYQGTIKETLNNLNIIKTHNREEHFETKAQELIEKKYTNSFVKDTKSEIIANIAESTLLLIYIGSMGFSVYHALNGDLNIGVLIVILLLTWFSIAPLKMVLETIDEIPKANDILKQFGTLKKINQSIHRHKKLILDDSFEGKVVFRDVTLLLAQSSKFTLNKINFGITRGDVLIINGPSGSGKSSILKLISGLYKQSSGNIFIDHDTNLLDEQTISENVILISNDTSFDNLSIYENLELSPIDTDSDDIQNMTNALSINADIDSNTLNKYPISDFKSAFNNKISYQEIINKIALSRVSPKTINKILLFDEPIIDGDLEEYEYFSNLINTLREANTIIISSRYDKYSDLADYKILLNNGTITNVWKKDEKQ